MGNGVSSVGDKIKEGVDELFGNHNMDRRRRQRPPPRSHKLPKVVVPEKSPPKSPEGNLFEHGDGGIPNQSIPVTLRKDKDGYIADEFVDIDHDGRMTVR